MKPADIPPPAASDTVVELERLQYLVDNTPSIIYCSDPAGQFKLTYVSNNTAEVLGYTVDQVMAAPGFWRSHLHPDDAPAVLAGLSRLMAEGAGIYEYRLRAASGEYLWVNHHIRLIRDGKGVPVEVIGSLKDISSRKAMEQEQERLIARLREAHDQLLQSEKMASIGQLAAGIAHEINNPVGFVNSNMGALKNYVDALFGVIDEIEQAAAGTALAPRLAAIGEKAELDFLKEDIAALVAESMDGLKRVRDIVQALKDFSHVGEAEWQFADLHRGLDTTLNIVANEIKYKATVEKHYGRLPEVNCLASQLNQVFMNLLVNAAHAIDGRGVITIRTGADSEWVWVAIGDNGCGIPAENLTRIFEPFFTTKPVGSGTGLGLSLSYSIVNKHGGKIDVESTPGVGTVFTVRLPVAPPAAAE